MGGSNNGLKRRDINMTQPKSKRPYSRFQILEDAKKIRNVTCALLLRDFGVKNRTRDPKFYTKVSEMIEGDRDAFIELLRNYHMESGIVDQYPSWYVDKLRNRVIDYVFNLVEYVEASNIYPQTIHECNRCRDYQNLALSKLMDLYQWMDLAATTLPIDKNKFDQYFDLIEKEIASIKSLRKKDNKMPNRIQNEEDKHIYLVIDEYLHTEYNLEGIDETTIQEVLNELVYRRGLHRKYEWSSPAIPRKATK